MKDCLRKYFWFIIALTVMLICAVFCVVLSLNMSEAKTVPELFSVKLGSGGNAQNLNAWSENNKDYYIFLPSYANMDELSLAPSDSVKFSFDGKEIAGETSLDEIEPDTAYDISLSNKRYDRSATLTFLKSANVATVYIDTISGNMKNIDKSKKNSEYARISVVTKEGKVEYAGDFTDEINVRGNATFYWDKKPYLLSLSGKASLLGMGASDKWVLLSNAMDESNLRNKLVLDFAKHTGLGWTPTGEFADVYLNGNYNGLYLLQEKISIDKDRLDLSSGSFIVSYDKNYANDDADKSANKVGRKDAVFVTDAGRTLGVTDAKNMSSQKCFSIMQEAENIILGKNGYTDSSKWSGLVDLDSLVRRFMIDEFFMNNDGDQNSSYYYYDGTAGKVYAGPAWDYDLCLGNTIAVFTDDVKFPEHIMANNELPYYSPLYNDETFFNRVKELYANEYLPLISSQLLPELEELSKTIERAAELNALRWREMFARDLGSTSKSADYIKDFINRRTTFLNDEWIKGKTTCSIWLNAYPEGKHILYDHYFIEKGTAAKDLPTPVQLGLDGGDIWYIQGTDKVFDTDTPITDQIQLSTVPASSLRTDYTETPIALLKTFIYQNLEILAALSCFLLFLFIMIVAEIRRRKYRG